MVEQTLTAVSPLQGYQQTIGDTVIRESPLLDIVSIAASRAMQQPLSEQFENKTGLSLPPPGTVNRNGDSLAILGMQADQWFMVSATPSANPVHTAATLFGDLAYYSDQSDSWAVIEIEGPSSRAALERICTLDLEDSHFNQASVARTVMEHMSVIVERPKTHLFRLYSPRSSAKDFLNAIVTSLHNVTVSQS